jgi:hypothetical protein
MATQSRFKTARELQEIAGAAASSVLPDEVAETLPVPTKIDGQVRVVILYYNTKARGQPVISPPHHAMILDPIAGKVIRFWACTPDDLGVTSPTGPVKGTGLDTKMSADEFWQKRDRFLEISLTVWEAYAAGNTQLDPQTKAVVREYAALLDQVEVKPLLPYEEAVAADFFAWLRKAAAP